MITKLDRAVTRYLHALTLPVPKDDDAIAAHLDHLDRLRYAALDLLIRRQRYSGLNGRRAWFRKSNPHRPPLA